jgi:tRNA(fMet)-specific endonuclease VapC
MTYLLDTNVCIALMNRRSARVRDRFAQAVNAGASLATSSVVVHELMYGAAKSERPEQNARVADEFLSSYLEILDFSAMDAQASGQIRAQLERAGKPIGAYDTLIAGQAFARDSILVTANTREFARIPGLKLEDWSV